MYTSHQQLLWDLKHTLNVKGKFHIYETQQAYHISLVFKVVG
jgi:hypothetical protein